MKGRCGGENLSGKTTSLVTVVLLLLGTFVICVSAQSSSGGSTVYPQNQTVLNGSSVTFPCEIPGANTSIWKDERNIQILNSNDGRITVLEFELRINPVHYELDQHGFYCVGLSNGAELSPSPTVYLDVLYAKYDFEQDLPSDMESYIGDDVVFTCLPPEANPPLNEWMWFKGLNANKAELQSVSGKLTVDNAQLTIHNASMEDGGFYACSVHNQNFSRTSMDSHLLIGVRPSPIPEDATVTIHAVTAIPPKLYALPGSNHTLMCNISVDAEPKSAAEEAVITIVWRKEGVQVTPDAKGNLQLYNFDDSQEGDYKCTFTLEFRGTEAEEDADVMVERAMIGEDISISPTEVTRGRGNRVEFTCQLPTANPTPSILWLKDNETLVTSSRLLILDNTTLVISDLELSDAGIYTCEAENLAGRRSTNATLTVEEFPTVTVNGGEVAYVKEGSNLSLSCQSSSRNASSYRWFFKEELVTNSTAYSLLTPAGDELEIKNISASLIGEYVCEAAEDSIHIARNGSASVKFTPELYIKYPPKNQTVSVGTDVTLVCEFRAHYADPDTNRLELKWYFKNPEVMNDTCGCIHTPSPEGHSKLFIRNVSVIDDGEYTCKAILNGTEEVVQSVTLSVTIAPYFVERPPQTVTVNTGESVTIECVADGRPLPTVKWIKGGEDLTQNGTLVLSNVQEDDAGIYQCIASGSIESLITTTNVVITTFMGLSLPADTIIVIVVGLVALILYLLIVIIILCTCAQCCRARLKKKHTEVLQMEAELLRTSRKTQDVKDNSAILRQTPSFSTGSAFATTSFAIPPSPSPMEGPRRDETVVSVDARVAYSIPSPLPSLTTTITEPIQLPNFSRRNLKLGDRLGEGEFGPIFLATAYGLSTDDTPMLVAVKVWMHPRDEEEESADYDLLNFYSQMRLRFDNIASIVGMCTDVEPFYVIYEYLDRGDLKQFLLDCRPDEIGIPTLTQENLLHIVKQVANGMAYLASQRIIHGDLASRSCIVSSDLRVKVADLGIGHDVYREDYYDNGEQLLPVRWMPPEILQTAEFTLHSDMWSFGVFCWEVFTFGRLPYEDVTDEEILRLIPQGLRLEVPEEGCPITLYSIMRECWNPHPEARPKFSRLVVSIIDLNLD